MNNAAALQLKKVKHQIESGYNFDAFTSANEQLVSVPTHDQAMFHHRAAMAADRLNNVRVARLHYTLSDHAFRDYGQDALGHVIMRRDQAMFEMRRASIADRKDVLERWLPRMEQDYRVLLTLPLDKRTEKELRVTLGFMTRLRARYEPGLGSLGRHLEEDWHDIASLCDSDGTKLIYELDALDELIRNTRVLSPLVPNEQLRRAARLSLAVGNIPRTAKYFALLPAKDAVMAVGMRSIRRFS